jgi:hypothetical protein
MITESRIRNNASFHYDAKLTARALKEIDKKFPDHVSSDSLGHDPLDLYYELGDFALDRIVVRHIFEVPEDADLQAVGIFAICELAHRSLAILELFLLGVCNPDATGVVSWKKATSHVTGKR